ncbi:MAG: hypothetical protein QUU85_07300, partial [Candidatus Eisenbacteria bacterium]|nr:hypothetical protein [Candidatus Eisenbacteria bacterium]
QIRLRERGVEFRDLLLAPLEAQLGASSVRLTIGEPRATRSQEIFGTNGFSRREASVLDDRMAVQ